MYKSFLEVFSCRTSVKLLSGVTPLSLKMVRYFPNSFEDYKLGADTKIDKGEIVTQITDHISNITKRLQPSRKNVNGGIYVGVTGASFMFYYLSKNPMLSENKATFMAKALEYLQPALETSAGDKTSFLIGDVGTYAIATVLTKEAGDDKFVDYLKLYKSLFNQYLSPRFLKCGGDEYFVGRAGYLAGALWMSRELQTPVFTNDELYKLCDHIVESGRDYAKRQNRPCPLMYHYFNTEYLGAAHGISLILQMLLSVPGYIEYNKLAAHNIKITVEYILSLQTEDGNWPCCLEEISLSDHKLVHWCHGAPGTIYLMAKAYLVYKEQMYYDACIKAGEVVWRKGLLRKGPGLCHGVAGNGYVFLLLHRLTGDKKYLYRAKAFADFMNTDEFNRDARLPDNPQSLYEGTAGTVCYLADLLVPDIAEFPFQDVFST